MRVQWFASLALASVLAACGGGGGSGDGGSAAASGTEGTTFGGGGLTLRPATTNPRPPGGYSSVPTIYVVPPANDRELAVDLRYSGGAGVMTEASIKPDLRGFDGHMPFCTLVDGSLPPGLTLQRDCSITGRATAPQHSTFTVRVGVPGASNTLDFVCGVTVYGPTFRYGLFDQVIFPHVGYEVYAPLVMDSGNTFDGLGTWTFRLKQDDSLPPGLTFEPATGTLRGTLQAEGNFRVEVIPTLTTAYGTYEGQVARWMANVTVEPSFSYRTLPLFTWDLGRELVLFAQPDSGAYSSDFSDFRVDDGVSLPAGLSLSPYSGALSGTAAQAAEARTYVISAFKASAGRRVQTSFTMEVASRVTITYASELTARTGVDVSGLSPTWAQNGALVSPTLASVGPRAGACVLPAGLQVSPYNGSIVGKTTETGTFDCTVDFRLTANGVTWDIPPSSFRLTVN